MIGRTIAHYRVTEKLGEGGMGEVYRARDERLNRDVALKVLPEAFANDADRLARFRREAQLLASLNHPNIAAIHGLEEADGVKALVLELVEGPTLAERIARGPIPLEEALEIARQVAEAVEEAHERGVTHRDLKPGNVKVTPEGKVKVLDFGLAKAFQDEAAEADISKSPTLTSPATQAGVILGTAAYMSPEQARGRPVDKRADVWAFGCVLYEMLTARQAFAGESVTDVIAAVVKTEPEWKALPAETPAPVHHLLRRCLEKDARRRLRDIGEARLLLEDFLAGRVEEPSGVVAAAVAPQAAWRRALPWGVAAVLALLAGLVAWAPWQSKPSPQPVRLRVEVSPEQPLNLGGTEVGGAAAVLSPDGSKLVFVAGSGSARRLYLRPLDQIEATPLSGTEGARAPFFSPDGQWIGFFTDDELKKVSVSGGAPLTLCETRVNRGGTWNREGIIVFALHTTTGLSRIAATGGLPEPITEPKEGERSHRWPWFLPDGKHVLFIVQEEGESYGDATIEAVNIETGERTAVHEGGTYPRYLPTGHLAFVRDGTLFAVPFDADRLEVTGVPAPLLEGISSSEAVDTGNGTGHYAFSEDGSLVYLTGAPLTADYSIVWADRKGETRPLVADLGFYLQVQFSPDSTRLAVTKIAPDPDIWVYEIEREVMTRLTFEGTNMFPVWSPDGRWIAFASDRHGGAMNLYVKRSDGAGEAIRLTESDNRQESFSFSPDQRFLAFHEIAPDKRRDVKILPLKGEDLSQPEPGEPQTFLSTPREEGAPVFSPDGRWIAHLSDESGPVEAYVRPFPGPGGKWQISTEGASVPYWTKGGREIVYRVGFQSKWMAVPISVRGDSLRPGRPTELFEGPFINRGVSGDYHVTPDGSRFIVFQRPEAQEEEQEAPTHVNLILNWFQEVRRLAPAGKN